LTPSREKGLRLASRAFMGTFRHGHPPEAWADLQAALDRLATGTRDLDAARKSRERMDRLREENRKRLGIQQIAVDLIRDSRDSR
jgi:hypothetical protein